VGRGAGAGRRGVGMARGDRSGLAVRHVVLLIVDHPYVDARHRPAESTRADLARLDVVREYAHHLRHPPDLDDREAETFLECPMQLRLDAGPDAEPDVVAP